MNLKFEVGDKVNIEAEGVITGIEIGKGGAVTYCVDYKSPRYSTLGATAYLFEEQLKLKE